MTSFSAHIKHFPFIFLADNLAVCQIMLERDSNISSHARVAYKNQTIRQKKIVYLSLRFTKKNPKQELVKLFPLGTFLLFPVRNNHVTRPTILDCYRTGSGYRLCHRDTLFASSDTCVSKSNTRISESDTCVSKSNTRVSTLSTRIFEASTYIIAKKTITYKS